ncbi:hypothetical protein CAEBREN_16926 [Caenorhabditis brenneri]|uniref:CCDC93 N-terminal domain-containing protein n=1 Tax=Caenorhabditis brenneri TaxID=135651 RepID=G0MAH0_CAEBE|nr:hypothetical protein CAEBREN_16926 [Caenorhabditis brenneri]
MYQVKPVPTAAATKELSEEEMCMEVLSLSKYHRRFEEDMSKYNTFIGSVIIAMNVYNSDCESKIIPLVNIAERDLTGKRAQCRAIITRLELMHCPHRVSLKALSELDFPPLRPMVEWLVNINVLERNNAFEFRQSFLNYFDQTFDTEMLALSEWRTQLSKVTDYAMQQTCTCRSFLSQVFGKNMTAEERMAKYAWIIRLHQEAHPRPGNCMGMNPPAAVNRPGPQAIFGEDTASDVIQYRTFLTDVLRKINIDQDLMYLDYKLECEARAHFRMKVEMEFFKTDLKELEAEKLEYKESALKAISVKLEEILQKARIFKVQVLKHRVCTRDILIEWGNQYLVDKPDAKDDKRIVYAKLGDYDLAYDKIIRNIKVQIYEIRKMIAKIHPSSQKSAASFAGSRDLVVKPLDTSHVDVILRLAYHITQGMEESQNVPEVDQENPDKAVLYYEAFFGYVDDLTQILYDFYWKSISMIKKRQELVNKYDGLRNKMRERQRKLVRYDQLIDHLFHSNNTLQQAAHFVKEESVHVLELRKEIVEMVTKGDSRNVVKNTHLKDLMAIEIV